VQADIFTGKKVLVGVDNKTKKVKVSIRVPPMGSMPAQADQPALLLSCCCRGATLAQVQRSLAATLMLRIFLARPAPCHGDLCCPCTRTPPSSKLHDALMWHGAMQVELSDSGVKTIAADITVDGGTLKVGSTSTA